MIDRLVENLDRTVDWIKFAEAKNAAVLTFSSVAFWSIVNILCSDTAISTVGAIMAGYASLLLFLAMLVSLVSFIPRLNNFDFLGMDKKIDDNYLFFAHACKYSASEYLDMMGIERNKNCEKECMIYAEQIVINSRIAFLKFRQFDLAVWFIIAAIASPVGILAIALYQWLAHKK